MSLRKSLVPIASGRSAAGVVLVFLASQAVASTAGPFVPLLGSWTGSGQVRLEDGRSEGIRCRASYTEKAPGVGLGLRCASSGSKIELRASMALEGGQVTGTWEERQFNAAGALTGTASGNQLKLAMEGGGLKANVAVVTEGKSQTVSITTDAGVVRGATIGLTRDAGP